MHPAGEVGPEVSGVDRILTFFPEAARSRATVREMAERLHALSRARSVGERLDAWMELVEWTREDPALLRGNLADAPAPEAATERLRLLLSAFHGTPEMRALVFDSLSAMLAEAEGASLFGETGLPSQRWFENWALYRRLPRIVAEHPLGARIGRERLRRFADSLARNASGWGTNVALGFLLGMTPAFGRFFGLPLDVRHVTLSTGTLALAAADLDPHKLFSGRVLAGAAGIAVMFVLNLSVSFLLSLASAVRAYGLPRRDVVALLGRLVRRFLSHPGQFLLPRRGGSSGAASEAHA